MATVTATADKTAPSQRVSLLRVLGPAHVWALGVGIVLVGEFTGWNFSADKGGTLAALITCWFVGLLYTSVAMIDSEVTSTVAAAGGQSWSACLLASVWTIAGDNQTEQILRRHRTGRAQTKEGRGLGRPVPDSLRGVAQRWA